MTDLLGLIGSLGGLIFLGFAALRWGVDSTDTIDSYTWPRRRNWRGYGRR